MRLARARRVAKHGLTIPPFCAATRYHRSGTLPRADAPEVGAFEGTGALWRQIGAAMDQDSAASEQNEATPIFGAYRRGYDPDQVDRFVADQRRRLDESERRASEAERKLAGAVGQLRELHRRVAMLESEERSSPQPASIDTLGERVQRILQEAWEGAYALRQGAEQEIAELREKAEKSAEEIVASARRKSEAIEQEIERRRNAYLEHIEEDRTRAVTQLGYLSEQRKAAVKELLHVKALIESTLNEVATRGDRSAAKLAESPRAAVLDQDSAVVASAPTAEPAVGASSPPARRREELLASTMPVHRIPTSDWTPTSAADVAGDTSTLVRSHREARQESRQMPTQVIGLSAAMDRAQGRPSVFDFEEEQPS